MCSSMYWHFVDVVWVVVFTVVYIIGTLRSRDGNVVDNRTNERSPRTPGEIEVPAPTAWPIVLRLESHYCSPAWSQAWRSAYSARCLLWRAALAGFAMFFLTSTKWRCQWLPRTFV